MGRYIEPKVRISRRFGELWGFTSKLWFKKMKYILSPGQHGKKIRIGEVKNMRKIKRPSITSYYSYYLLEKQVLRYIYGLRNKQLLKYYHMAKTSKYPSEVCLLNLCEARLDVLSYKIGLGETIASSRQFVNHGHIQINRKSINIPSYLCKKGDIITIKPTSYQVVLMTYIQIVRDDIYVTRKQLEYNYN
jgi:small subunit ribosomal protein S4